METLPLLIILIIMLAYLDYSFWYSAEMHNIWSEKKKKFRGILWRFWDFIGRDGE
jgi:hypothetical protein